MTEPTPLLTVAVSGEDAVESPEVCPDTGLACLVMLARYHGLAADPDQIAPHQGVRSLIIAINAIMRDLTPILRDPYFARGNGLSVNALKAVNPQITHPDLIHPGQVINVPTRAPDNSRLGVSTWIRPTSQRTGVENMAQMGDVVNFGFTQYGPSSRVWMPVDILNGSGLRNTGMAGVVTNGFRPGNVNPSTGGVRDLFITRPVDILGPNPFSLSVSSRSIFFGTINNVSTFGQFTRFVDPLVLDLNGDGVKLSDYKSDPVLFDIDNDGGSLEVSGWVSAQDGILVMDLNNNGRIDNISETFSEYFNGTAGTGGNAGTKPYKDGFAALKSQDSNNDNVFNSGDAAFNNVRVWVDANHDGKTDAGELKTLASLNITQINLAATAQSGLVRDGNEVLSSGSFVQNGQTKEALALNFLTDPNGHSFVTDGSGTKVITQGGVSAYAAGSAAGEAIDVAVKGVTNAYGAQGNDILTGDTGNNWLVGGGGSDTFNAGAGDDVLLVDANDLPGNILGGEGIDIVQVVGSAGVTLNMAQAEVEVVQGGRGDDIIVSGGNSNTFVRGGEGNDLLLGGTANDALSGEDGDDVIDGGAGNDLLRGHRGRDRIIGAAGDDIIEGGQDDDTLDGGAGNDVLLGGEGDDRISGGDGLDLVEYGGRYSDYRITRSDQGIWVSDLTGREGTDFLTGVEQLSFTGFTGIDINSANPLPVEDTVVMPGRTTGHLISKQQLLGNDIDFQGDSLSIREVLEAVGGTAALTAVGDVLFTPDPNFKGVMGFRYKIQDSQGNAGATAVDPVSGAGAEIKGAVYLKTPDLPDDAQFKHQWYITDANILPVWQDYTGKGVRIGLFEPSGKFAEGPEVLDYRHPDLAPSIDPKWLANENPPATFSQHATMVAGVMVAARNSEGTVGVAYGAKLAGQHVPADSLAGIARAMDKFKDFDVVNNSWAPINNFEVAMAPGTVMQGIADATMLGRGGLGSTVIFGAGNSREIGSNTNYSALTNNHAVITVGAINAAGDAGNLVAGTKPFSNPGASILISAPGSNVASTSRLLMNDNGSTFGNDYTAANGTSLATPIVSGVVALMLEANPRLGYRDIQEILALTATRVDDPSGTDWVYNGARNWNGGGMHVSHDYGYGKIDARAAVRLAESWNQQSTAGNLQAVALGPWVMNSAIPEGAGRINDTRVMPAGYEVEFAEVTIDIDHPRWGDLVIKLISPSGVESVLVDRPGKAPGSGAGVYGDTGYGTLNLSFGSTHYRGEQSGGNWTLQVYDAATGQTGTLKNWSLKLYGTSVNPSDQYVYTDEFAALGVGGRAVLSDANGGFDVINVAAVSGNTVVNLNAGAASTIAGKTLTIDTSTVIEAVFAGEGNDTLIGNGASNQLWGGRGADTLSGGAGVDYLEGNLGNDVVTGGSDRDYFIIFRDPGTQDVITDFNPAQPGEKIMLRGFSNIQDINQITKTQEGANLRLGLGDGQGVLLYNVSAAQITDHSIALFDNSQELGQRLGYLVRNTPVSGSTGNDNVSFMASAGPLSYYASDGNDRVIASPGHDLLEGGAGNDSLQGWDGNDVLDGGSGDDVLGDETTENGDDVLIGGSGRDRLLGGGGKDVFYMDGDLGQFEFTGSMPSVSPRVIYGAGAGLIDSASDRFVVQPSAKGTPDIGSFLNAFGNLTITARNFIADFETSTDKIDLSLLPFVKGFADVGISQSVIRGAYITTVRAGSGSDAIYINLYGIPPGVLTAGDFVFAKQPAAMPAINGGGFNDALHGNAGGNIIDGGAGADTMTGRTGDDTYTVDNAGDVVNELPGGGFDAVRSSVSYALPADVENLVLTGATAINGTGNAQNNRVEGNVATNRLDGGAGADTMLGGGGNDVYVVDNTADRVLEFAGNGTDMVDASVSYTLSPEVENLTLTGTAAINATGNALNNVLAGNSSNNTLDGASGADSMSGGAGDDIYLVDNAGDAVSELLDQGIDSVYAGIDYTLGANVENLLLLESSALSGTGNVLDNVLTGNSAANALNGGAGDDVLEGGAGADTLTGGIGNDIYMIDNADDKVTENLSEGNDTVQSMISYMLGANVENLVLTGSAVINGTGNTLDNHMVGNVANNTLNGGVGNDILNGGGGADTLIGGTGNDTYVVDNTGDVVTENPAEGVDTVQSSITYALGANVENLTLTGAAVNGTGNALSNKVVGNAEDNLLIGLGGNDTLEGGAGNDYLGGGTGADSMAGGLDDDYYYVDSVGDVVIENANEGDWDTVESRLSHTLGANVEALQLGYGAGALNGTGNAANNYLYGNESANVLTGLAGNDELDGGDGLDTLAGGSGDDTYYLYAYDGLIDNVVETAGEGTDTVYFDSATADAAYTLGANVENLASWGNGLNLTGNALANMIIGDFGNNTLNGGAGADILIGQGGNDTYIVDNAGDVVTENLGQGTDTVQSSVSYVLGANVENLTLTGVENINGTGNSLNNTLLGNSGGNRLDGGAGADTLKGGTGDDYYVLDTTADVVVENPNEGVDYVMTAFSATLGAYSGVEVLILQSGGANLNGTGDGGDNFLLGNGGNNTLTGLGGNDGLNGSEGADTLVGGTGNDTYYVDNGGDIVIENTNEGADTVYVGVYAYYTGLYSYTLTANVENLISWGEDMRLTGNSLANTIIGDYGGNRLDGAGGADTLMGGDGDDTYVVDTAGDVVMENANEGFWDTVESSVSYTLGENVENLVLTGTSTINGIGNSLNNAVIGNSANNILTGGEGADWLYGGAGADTLNGGAGADTLRGGVGNDTYVVDNAGDVVTENASEGWWDTVESSISYTLGANVENLTLMGSAAINGTGNALNNGLLGNGANNVLTGGAGNDYLDGGAGADSMVGGLDDDYYYVDSVGDVVIESVGEGDWDMVESRFSYTLGANVESLHLGYGAGAINGTGNAANNYLAGNESTNVLTGLAGNDELDGGDGLDTLMGGVGDDTYDVWSYDGLIDIVTENAGEGTDTVRFYHPTAGITYTLTANVENAVSDGAGLNLTGNALNNNLSGDYGNNVLNGGAGADTLVGGYGNDVLDGGLGNDYLDGGAGNDVYLFGRGAGADLLSDYDTTVGNTDRLAIGTGVTAAQLWFRRVGADLEMSLIGTGDRTTISGWYNGAAYRVEQFRTADGKTLLDSRVDNLVSAMASFTPPVAGQTTLPPGYQTTLNPVIAANWQ